MEADHFHFSKLVWEGMSRLIEVTITVNSFDSTGFNAEVYGVYKVPGRKVLSFEYDKKTALKIFNDDIVLTLNAEVYVGSLKNNFLMQRN